MESINKKVCYSLHLDLEGGVTVVSVLTGRLDLQGVTAIPADGRKYFSTRSRAKIEYNLRLQEFFLSWKPLATYTDYC